MRSRRLLLAPLLLAALAPMAAGCTSTSSTRTASDPAPSGSKAPVASVNWRNATYSVGCPGLGGPSDQQVPVTLVNGSGRTAPVTWFGAPIPLDVRLVDVAYGDLTGDGQDDAVVHLTCTPDGSNGVADELQVFGPGSELLASPILRNRFSSDFAPSIIGLRVTGGHVTGMAHYWSAGDPHCCPSQTLPFTLTWNPATSSFTES